MMKHYNIWISGKVQRVGFRFTAMQTAYRYGILGFIQNMKDGTVYIEAEGEEGPMKCFFQWCNKGPYGSKVDNVEVRGGDLKNFKTFDIISSRQQDKSEQ